MDIKKILKINYKLGSNFLLFPTVDSWILMRTGSYRIIMDGKNNTEEELEQFIKEHREYNALAITRRFGIIANTIILGLCVANLFIHSVPLTYFNMGAIIILLPLLILLNHIGFNNHEVFSKVLDEDMNYFSKILNEEDVKKKKSTRAKRGRKKSSEIQE